MTAASAPGREPGAERREPSAERRAPRAESGEPMDSAARGAGPYLRRFTPLQSALHIVVVVSFTGLVVTGMPLHFSYAPWAWAMIHWMGGFEVAGTIHRICAVLTFGYFFVHVGDLTVGMLRAKDWRSYFWGPNSMIPQPRDVRDVVQMFRYFFGKAEPPKFDRFGYMEKFDYWGEVWGVFVIGGTGLMLWFPEFFALFLPGWMFNVATIIHGIEAILASGVIFTAHFFNVHVRPHKFPIDTVIFTGRATTEYYREEHPLEYERAKRDGTLERMVAPRPSRATYVVSMLFGFTALTIGLLMIALILAALLG